MPAIKINKVTNANVLLDGGSLLGSVSKVELPDLTAVMVDHEAMGMIGKTQHFAGYESMEAKFTWNAFYADILRQIANPFNVIGLAVYANMDVINGEGLQEQQGVTTFIRGVFKNYPTGSFSQMENVDGLESMMCVYYIKQVIAGATVFEFDALNNALSSNGVDLSATYRNNLGL